MTKKDYIVIAEMLEKVNKWNDKGLTKNQKMVFSAIVYQLGTIFIEDNKNFDREKFEGVIYD